MPFSSLYILDVFTDGPAMLLLNGEPAIELFHAYASLPVARDRFLLTLLPLSSREKAISVSRVIDLKQEQPCILPKEGTETIYLVSKERVGLFLPMPKLSPCRETLPYILAQKTEGLQKQYRATVYFDRAFNFAIEEQDNVIFCASFSVSAETAEIIFKKTGKGIIVTALCKNKAEQEAIIVLLKEGKQSWFQTKALKIAIVDNQVEVYQSIRGITGCQLQKIYAEENGAFLLRQEKIIKQAQAEIGDSRRLLVQAILSKDENTAFSCLSSSLRSALSFEDLAEFFGTPSEVIERYSSDKVLALAYQLEEGVFQVRQFLFDVQNGIISNITEKEESESMRDS